MYVRPIMHTITGNEIPANSPFDATSCSSGEVFTDLVGTRLPLFDPTTTTVEAGTDGLITQFAYPDSSTTPDQLFEDLMGLEGQLMYWAAWESYPRTSGGVTLPRSRAEWSSWPTAVRFDVTMVDGIDLPTSTDEVYDRVAVRWKDAAGKLRSTEVAASNDILDAAGFHRWGTADASDAFVADTAGAVDFGTKWLADHAYPRGAGTVTVSRELDDLITGRKVAPWELASVGAFLIRIPAADLSAAGMRATARNGRNVFRVVAVDVDLGSATAKLSLDTFTASQWAQLSDLSRNRITRRR